MKFNKFISKLIINKGVPMRKESIGNVDYTVVPVTMMTVGVHSGSGGPVFYSAQELNEMHVAWNGVPVTVQHPSQDGNPVSANSPQFYEDQVIGKIFNTTFVDNKLKAEAWLEINKSASILSFINSGGNLEVSTGLFSEDDFTPGNYQGEQYEVQATKIRPDHLALLPGNTGACSWEDGCGVRANKKEGDDVKRNDSGKKDNKKELIFNYLIEPDFKVNEIDYSSMMDLMYDKIDSLDIANERMAYLRKLYDSFVVYKMEYRNNDTRKLYKRNYQLVNGAIEWTSDPVEVQEVVTYTEIPNTNEDKGDKIMADEKEKKDICCEEEVKAFVANEDNGYTDKDVEWMKALPEASFRSIVANTKTPEKKEEKKEEVIPKAQTFDEVLANASPEIRESIQHGQDVLKRQKSHLIDVIKANKSNQFTDLELNGYSIQMLEKLAGSIQIEVPTANYALQNGTTTPTVNEEVVEPLIDVWTEEKESK